MGAETGEDFYGEDKATLGDRLTAAREAAGIAAREMADRLGVRHRTLQSWEDDRSEPRANHLRMAAGVMGVSLVWLMTGTGSAPRTAEGGEIGASDAARAELAQLRDLLRQAEARIGRLEQVLANV